MSADPVSVWVVDDHLPAAQAVAEIARDLGFAPRVFGNATAALAALASGPCDVLVTDLRMPGVDGLGLLDEVRKLAPDVSVVVVTAYGSIDEAVRAMRSGALDFLTKPLALERVEIVLRNAASLASVRRELARTRAENQTLRAAGSPELVFRSAAIRAVLDQAERAAASDATVLVLGESGTGKERVARAIHDRSARSRGPFVATHVAALSEGVLESELFGHEKGAFTGATARHPGRFEVARGGTLFLDEVGEIDPRTQVKLLRVLQERVVVRVGGTDDVPIDVRLVAATHRDLRADVEAGRFRADLYYRLDVVQLVLPPLRDRPEDVPVLLAHFLERSSARYGRPVPDIPVRVAEALLSYGWPGNVRELENVAERLVVMGASEDDLPSRMLRPGPARPAALVPSGDLDLTTFLESLEREILDRALRRAAGNKTQAARSLSLSREAFRYKLAKYGLD